MDNPAASNNTFTHEPLPEPTRYIRLLEVLDDKHSKTIKVRCRLTTWPVDSAPSYHAISYTWGDPESNTFILLNDKAFQVRTNCEFALKQAYWFWKKRSFWPKKTQLYYWIDSICIHQTNLEEKGHQVSMMGNIYKNASHVLACIGDHFDDSLFLFQKLYGLKRHVLRIDRFWRSTSCEGHCIGISRRFQLTHRYSTTNRFVLAWAHLALRPYFTRVWILQELQHAQELTILCGQDALSKDDAISLFRVLWDAYECFDGETPWPSVETTRYSHACHEDLLNVRFLRRNLNHGFPHPQIHGHWLLQVSRRSIVAIDMLTKFEIKHVDHIRTLISDVVCRLECTDTRDKVYGIISLIDWGDVEPPLPDYTQTDLEVAIQFTKAIMTLWRTHETLQEVRTRLWQWLVKVIKLLNLDTRSLGLDEALEARRGPPKDYALGPKKSRDESSTLRIRNLGWRLLDEDIENSASKLRNLQSSPPTHSADGTFFLPRWARAGDWVSVEQCQTAKNGWYTMWDRRRLLPPTYIPFLVMRETGGKDSSYIMLVGYGFYASGLRSTAHFMRGSCTIVDSDYRSAEDENDGIYIEVNLSIEDGLLFLLRIKQLNELSAESSEWMVDFLETGVCRRKTPWSSYGMLPSDT